MQRVGMILDVTHLSDESFLAALDRFDGPVMASHHNCRALVPGDRQLTDEQIRLLLQRGAVIGVAFDAWMLHSGWQIGGTNREVVDISAAADHIDHICQLAGNSDHAAIGSDLDGGFGTEQTPVGLDSIADLQKLVGILSGRGYKQGQIDAIFHGNWLRFFKQHLP
jgi:membrane dipeptidase